MEPRRAPALSPGIDREAYLAAGGIPEGALIITERGRAPYVVTTAEPAPEPAGNAALRSAVYGGLSLSSAQTVNTAGAGFGTHPILRLTGQMGGSGVEHRTQLTVLHAMRRFYPTLDAAIGFRRALEGDITPTSDDEGLQEVLQAFWADVPVGYVEGAGQLRGGDEYVDLISDAADEYGYAAGEIVLDEDGRTIERLVVPNARTLALQEVQGTRGTPRGVRWRLHQTADGRGMVALDGALVQALAFRPASESPWPLPVAWSLVQTTEAVLRMYQAVQNVWWRFGDPSMLLGIEYDPTYAVDGNVSMFEVPGTDMEVPTELWRLKTTLETIMEARRNGRAGDAYVATMGGKIKNEVLGQVEASMMRYFREQSSQFDGLVTAAAHVPSWLFPTIQQAGDGLGGSLSNNQNAIYSTAAHRRNEKRGGVARGVLDAFLVANGDARFVGKYDLEYTEVNIMDEKLIEETRKAKAEADAAVLENVTQLYEDDGAPRFAGDAERYLEENGVL